MKKIQNIQSITEVKKENFRIEEVAFKNLITLELLGYLIQPCNWADKAKSYSYWLLIYVNKGAGVLHYGNKQYDYTYDSVWILKPDMPYHFENTSRQKVELLYIGFSFDISKDVSFKLNSIAPYFSDIPGGIRIIKELKALCDFFRQYTKEVAFQVKRGEVLEILARMFNFISSINYESTGVNNLRNLILTENAKRYLEDNTHRNISVREVADLFYISSHYFGDIFKQCTGMSLKEYHCALRMHEAEKLLEENKMNVSEIAARLGFDNLHYFSRKFKQVYSVPPSHYQKK